MKYIRPILSLAGLLGVFFAPVWVPCLCILLLALRFRAWEVVVIGALIDMLWLPPTGIVVFPVFTLFAIGVVWILEPLRLQLLR